jgi:hypothetical protein
MPRVKTKGEAISIRLEVHVDDKFQWEADEAGKSPRDLACEILTAWVEGRTGRRHAGAEIVDDRPAPAAGAALTNEFFR